MLALVLVLVLGMCPVAAPAVSSSPMRGMILAAGYGTRLGGLSDQRPKPLLPVCDVPLVRWVLALLSAHGVREVVVNTHHRGEQLEAELGAEVLWSHERGEILGTGGGIRHARPLLGAGTFVVANGKIVFDLDLHAALAHHRKTGAVATLIVRADRDAARWGAIDVDEQGQVRGLLGAGGHMFTGVHLIEPALLDLLPAGQSCIVRQGYVPALARGMRISAYVAPGYFFEHSTPARYLEGNLNLLFGRASVRHPPGPLTGVSADAIVAHGAAIDPATLVAAGGSVGADARLGPGVVVGRGAAVAPGADLERVVVWPAATASGHLRDAIVTPKGTFPATG